ncbi:hypothetical protein AMTRI_Chr09g18540 [Amborella trichopoda]
MTCSSKLLVHPGTRQYAPFPPSMGLAKVCASFCALGVNRELTQPARNIKDAEPRETFSALGASFMLAPLAPTTPDAQPRLATSCTCAAVMPTSTDLSMRDAQVRACLGTVGAAQELALSPPPWALQYAVSSLLMMSL